MTENHSKTTYLEYSDKDSGSHKFYQVTVAGNRVTIRYGRIGTQGQTNSTTYPSAEKAEEEAAKKVGAKLKKGYEPAVPDERKKRALSERRRTDVYVYNEANSFWLASKSLGGRNPAEVSAIAAEGSDEALKQALLDGLFIPIGLAQDDGFVVRVLVGELNQQEEAEWVGRITWKLNIPCGKLGVSGGWAILERDKDPSYMDYLRDFVRYVDVPPGEYQVEVYAFLPNVTAMVCLEDNQSRSPDAEPLGAYHRRTRPGQDFPGWLKLECLENMDADPEYGDYWESYELTERELDKIESEIEHLVDLVIRLAPLEDEPQMPRLENGCFEWKTRRPEICPLGIMSANLRGLLDE